jgi:hypothetical protein
MRRINRESLLEERVLLSPVVLLFVNGLGRASLLIVEAQQPMLVRGAMSLQE